METAMSAGVWQASYNPVGPILAGRRLPGIRRGFCHSFVIDRRLEACGRGECRCFMHNSWCSRALYSRFLGVSWCLPCSVSSDLAHLLPACVSDVADVSTLAQGVLDSEKTSHPYHNLLTLQQSLRETRGHDSSGPRVSVAACRWSFPAGPCGTWGSVAISCFAAGNVSVLLVLVQSFLCHRMLSEPDVSRGGTSPRDKNDESASDAVLRHDGPGWVSWGRPPRTVRGDQGCWCA